jgi:hypothetical protein
VSMLVSVAARSPAASGAGSLDTAARAFGFPLASLASYSRLGSVMPEHLLLGMCYTPTHGPNSSARDSNKP